ncbi:FAD-dependent oxidoreductase [Vibrio hannami]|uniref:NAD(P)/FAD-dependent oxidoreductase n=1 Tax=Vibrio hannami TaxID=2717094 RepID=UPI00240EA75C|nr:FAD-dependent oxidoreductase [Vibrio hannami]MDG3087670.1 FAD-dependent oxidoreductase [Vibrio hannami]
MKIAIIGSGISGLTCAYYLNKNHDITLFEANDYIGGHTATVDVEVKGKKYKVDTGFIVYNDRTYPNFINLMNEIGVEGKPTEMSFSVRNDEIGLEYNGHSISTLFAQKSNLFNPQFYRFIREILKFNELAKQSVSEKDTHFITLGDFLTSYGFSDYFTQNYLLPMGAAIWSSTIADIRKFPMMFFMRFFRNHGLLDVKNRPQWHVIKGGSNSYVEPMTREFKDKIKLNSPVEKVWRDESGVHVVSNGNHELFDEVVFACHSDQALNMIQDKTLAEQTILPKLKYQANEVTLHLDTGLLPKRRKAWASWNYQLPEADSMDHQLPTLTYNMNILQGIQSDETFCVSLNSSEKIRQDKILKSFVYHHPLFNRESSEAQSRRAEINGNNRSWFCGAYWYNGFHEDGVRSALDVVRAIEAKAIGVSNVHSKQRWENAS